MRSDNWLPRVQFLGVEIPITIEAYVIGMCIIVMNDSNEIRRRSKSGNKNTSRPVLSTVRAVQRNL